MNIAEKTVHLIRALVLLKRSCHEHGYLTGTGIGLLLMTVGSCMGDSFAFYRGSMSQAQAVGPVIGGMALPTYPNRDGIRCPDLKALQFLSKTRTQQLERLSYNIKQKSLVTEALQSVGLFSAGIYLVLDYAELTDHDIRLENNSPHC